MVQHAYDDHSGEENTDEEDSGSVARVVRLISGEYLLTVNPVDGSEIEPCPPGQRPGAPRKRAVGDRPGAYRADAYPSDTGRERPAALLEREEERERLARLLRRGHSVRLTGARGSGRTALLDAVAADVADMAPDGVVRLSGYRRTGTDLLQDLFSAVHDAPNERPGRHRLREALSTVGAVVVIDDLEFGGGTLDELLTATPECAYLVAATPDVAAPSEQARIEEVFLAGLSRTGSLELLERLLDRPLTDDESDWAGDLWFLSEGKPLTFVQAATLLRQQGGGTAVAVYGDDDAGGGLPSGADIAGEVAKGLSRCARASLRLAVSLGGELPEGTHLPALLNEDHADEAPVELLDAGLVTEAGGHLRLASGVARQLGTDAEDGDPRVDSVAHHYAWWVTHPSVAAARVAAEADVVAAAVQAAQRGGRADAAVLLARAAAPVLAAASRWGVWERVLRGGQEAARTAGEVAEQAYFHHELGVLALCQGNPERARTELDASIALRAALADKHGTVTGRRALALVTDRLAADKGGAAGALGTPAGPTTAGAMGLPGGPTGATGPIAPGRVTGSEAPTGGATGPGAAAGPTADHAGPTPDDTPTAPTPKALHSAPAASGGDEDARAAALSRAAAMDDSIAAMRAAAQREHDAAGSRRTRAARGKRRNALAAGAGAVLAAVLGTVVTLGAASDDTDDPSGGPTQPDHGSSLTEDYGEDPAEAPTDGGDAPDGPAPAPAGTPVPTSEASPTPAHEQGTVSGPSGGSDPTPDDGPGDPSGSGGNSTGGSDGGSGGDDNDGDESPRPTPSPTESSDPPESPEPEPTPTEEPTGTQNPPTSGQADGDSLGPTANGPASEDTQSGTSPAGSGGTGGSV